MSNFSVKKILMAPLAVLGVLAMLVEEWLWGRLVAFGHWIGQMPVLRTVEARLRVLSPNMAACALLFPVLLILPVKILAVWIMSTGRWGLGVTVLLSAKVAGTALVARIYTVCEPALSTLLWFVHTRAWFLDAKDWAHRRLESWELWRLARQAVHGMKCRLFSLLGVVPKPE